MSLPQSFIRIDDNHFVACHEDNFRLDARSAWFKAELRLLLPNGINEGAADAFCLRLSALQPWQREAEMKMMLESVRDSIDSRSSEYGALSFQYGDTSWRTEARDRLNEAYVYGQMFDDIVAQEERDKADDAERRAKCADQARRLN